MTGEKREKIRAFLKNQVDLADFRLKGSIYNDKGQKNPGRNVFVKLRKYINVYQGGNTSVRWLVMSGLRGVGKTTLLAQLYYETKVEKERKLFLTVDQITQALGVTLRDVLEVYEEIQGGSFEKLEQPVFLFLDEVQYDEDWSVLLKTIFDRSKKVFIVVTGSSALQLQSITDDARRTVYEKLFPMSFTEYMKIRYDRYESKGLCNDLRKIFFESNSAREVHNSLFEVQPRVREYWKGLTSEELTNYMHYGTLPFMVALNNEALVYDQIKKTLDRVVTIDITQMEQFAPDILAKIPSVLYAIADSDKISLNSMSKSLGISRPTLEKILRTLESTETILRVYPHGSHMVQARKESKYLFVSPAFRAMYFNFIGSTHDRENYNGKILEDTVGLYLNRYLFKKIDVSLTYDSAEGGADFIVRVGKRKVILEVGQGEKGFRQAEFTLEKVGGQYGIIASRTELKINQNENVVSVPLSYFLLF